MKLSSGRKKFVRTMALLLVTVLSLSALAACSPRQAQVDETERVLRIATLQGYSSDDQWFRQQFTELFEFANKNITIEIVPAVDYSLYYNGTNNEQPPDPMVELKKMMQGDNPPDLVMLEYNYLSELINENLLMPLDPLITADKFDTSKIVPTVIDGIKEAATDGKLYALAPLFSSSALFYNRTIFTEAGVPYPQDGMTWDEIFNLARQVTGGTEEKPIYGFAFNTYQGSDVYYDMQTYTQPLQLNYFDDSGDSMTVDSDQWENIWRLFIDLSTQKVLPETPDWSMPREYGPYDWDNFLSGRVAMAISGYYYINELINANRTAQTSDNYQGVDWDVVTLPTHPEAPGVGGQIYMQGLMGINAKAQNQKDAWEFLKFMNGEDWARLKSKSQSNLVARVDYLQPKDGMDYNIEAFYQLKPVQTQNLDALYRKYPNIYSVQYIGQQKFQEVLQGDKEVRQALKEWQTEGDAILEKMRENPDYYYDPWAGEYEKPMPITIDSQMLKEAAGEATEVVE